MHLAIDELREKAGALVNHLDTFESELTNSILNRSEYSHEFRETLRQIRHALRGVRDRIREDI